MRPKLRPFAPTLLVSILLLLVACSQPVATVAPELDMAAVTTSAPLLNEVLGSTTGTDVEFIEIFAPFGTSLAGLSVIVVEGDAGAGVGAIDARIDLQADTSVCENSFFLIGTDSVRTTYSATPDLIISSNTIENSSYTIALVSTSSISGTTVTGSEVVLDAVGVTDGGAEDSFFFDAPVVGPDGSFLPAGVRRVQDGVDTDTASDWAIADFNNGPANTPTASDCERDEPASDTVRIHEIQGSGGDSPLDETPVQIEAIVVGDFQRNGGLDDGDLRGFYLQEEDAEADSDPSTSEGIFVFDGNGAVDVAVGDLVRVAGTVAEFFGETQIDAASVEIVSTSNPLPTAATVTLPLAGSDWLERVEGMRVVLPQPLVISEYFNYDRFGEIVLALPFDGLDRPFQPTAYDTDAFNGLTPEETLEAIQLRRIFLDDGRNDQNPPVLRHPNGDPFALQPLELENRFRGGDTVANVTGVVRYSKGSGSSGTEAYRIQPTAPADYTAANPRDDVPDEVGGGMTVAAFNVLNYFTTVDDGPDSCGPSFDQECRGADTAEEFARQQAKIVAALVALDADVIGLIEIQNNAGPVAALADALNTELGANVYVPILTGSDGTDAIKVGLVYRIDRVVPVGAPVVLEDPSFTNPRDADDQKNRPALAQTFADLGSGGVATVVVNHFKSKGSSCGSGDDDPLAGSCNLTRTLAAQALTAWLDSDPTGVGDADVLVIGDINAYDEEDPIGAFIAAGYTDLVEAYEGEFAYTYVFDGQFGHLDYSLASPGLLPQVTGATTWHINADEPDILGYDTDFKPAEQEALYAPDPFRSSDHDPVLVGLDLEADPEVLMHALRTHIEALSAAGDLNRGQTRSLESTLDAAERSTARGQVRAAINQIGAFQNHIHGLEDDGVLDAADAHYLVTLADALVAASS